MIQLYKASNTNFDFNGDYNLFPESCELECELNGTWTLTLIYPRSDNDETFNEIKTDAVIKVQTWLSDEQLFRIYEIDKTDIDVTAYARPIFLDAKNDAFLFDCRPTECTGQQALDKMCSGTKYSGSSNITDISTAFYVRKNLIEAIGSSDENSFINRWGGEIIYNNYKITINKSAGYDRGVSVRFGKNMMSIEQNVNTDNVATRLVPISYNGYTITEKYVDSPRIGKYANIRTRTIEYGDVKLKEDSEEEGFDTIEELQEELRRRCSEEFKNGIDLPKITYSVDMIELSQYEEYKDVKILERVFLGDTVTCVNEHLDISTRAKVIKLTFDCMNCCNNKITLGDYEYNYLDDMKADINSLLENIDAAGKVKGESIAGVIDLMQAKLKASHEIAKKQVERAILFEDNDPESPTYGAMSLGTTGFQIASKKNLTGDWIWTTFGTGEGFMANCIIAGILYSINYEENKQGLKIDLNKGLIEAFNLAWKASKSQMTSDGKLTVSDILINGGSFNINDMFKVTKDGKLSWSAAQSSMTEDGKIECSSLNMTGGKIQINAQNSLENLIQFIYKQSILSIATGNIHMENSKYSTEITSNNIGTYQKDNYMGASISINGITYYDGNNIRTYIDDESIRIEDSSGLGKKTIILPGAIKMQDGDKIKIITASSEG